MEINIFPFACKIYIVRCVFCDKFLGHLVLGEDEYGEEDAAHKRFRWCPGEECGEKIEEARKRFKRWLSVELFTGTSTI